MPLLSMCPYLQRLNTNHSLYKAVMRVEQEAVFPTREAERMAHSLRVDFERGGIHLCARIPHSHDLGVYTICVFFSNYLVVSADKLERVNQLNNEISLLGREYVPIIDFFFLCFI